MEKQKIPIITLAIFSIIILLANNNNQLVYGALVRVYNVTTDNGTATGINGRNSSSMATFDGERITVNSGLLGVEVTRIDIKIFCVRATNEVLGGTAYIGVWNSSIAPTTTNYKKLITSFNPDASLSCSSGGTSAWYNYTISNGYTFQTNDAIGLFYNFVTASDNTFLGIRSSSSSTYDGTNTLEVYYRPFGGAGWTTQTRDINMVLWQGEEDEVAGSSGNVCLNVDANGDGRINALDCTGNNALAGLTASQNMTQVGNTLLQGVGIIDPDNDDIQTNGVGLLYMLMTGVFFAGGLMATISKLNSKGWVNMTVKEIDPIFWLFLVIGVVGASWYIGWIPDIIFYGMIVGLAGLLALGALKHFGRI